MHACMHRGPPTTELTPCLHGPHNHCARPGAHAMQGIQSRLMDTKAVGEVQAMGDFFSMLSSQPDRAQYGFNHVKVAVGL